MKLLITFVSFVLSLKGVLMKADIQGEIRIKCFLPTCSGGLTALSAYADSKDIPFFCMIMFFYLLFIL